MNTQDILSQLVLRASTQTTIGEHGPFEVDVVFFIESFLRENLSEKWIIERQEVTDTRYNLIVHDSTNPDVLLLGHMDTVEIGQNWTKNNLGEVDGSLMYGRGTADMKAGLAVIMQTLLYADAKGIAGVMGLFYCDEEYNFAGMKTFVAKYIGEKPALAVCPEPTGLRIRQGVRGCFETHIQIRGKSGHAARPDSGVNSFRVLTEIIDAIDTLCSTKTNQVLGKPTVNITGVRCGLLDHFDVGGKAMLRHDGNVIPDYAEAVIEIRVTPEITKEEIVTLIEKTVVDSGATLINNSCFFDLGTYSSSRKDLVRLANAQKDILGAITYDDPACGGYSDIQMIAQAWGVPCALFGPIGKGMHGPDEYVELESVKKLEKIFQRLISP